MIPTYYAVVTDLYRKFWGDHFHATMWFNDMDSLDISLEKTHAKFIKDANLDESKTVLDFGCGIGTLSFYIASKTRCKVYGINISDYQLKLANKTKKKQGLENVKFVKQDIMDLRNFKEKGDVAFLIDVGCHLPNKEKALKSIASVLNSKGRIIIADWLMKENLNSFERELLIEPFHRYWSLPYMDTFSNYKKILKKAGFEIVIAEDVSAQVKKTWETFYKVTLEAITSFSLIKMLSFIFNPTILKNQKLALEMIKTQAKANLISKVCSDAGVFKYGYFVAVKIR